MSDQTHISSGAMVLRKQNGNLMVLMMYREKTDSWHLPKGTRNHDENLEETAIREVEEETGFKIKLGKYLGKLDSKINRDGKIINKETHYFLAEPVSGDESRHDAEHDAVMFVEFTKALKYLEKFSLYEKEGEVLRMFQESSIN